MSKYTETFDMNILIRVEVEVEGAESEELAQALVNTYVDLAESDGCTTYTEGDGRVTVMVTATVQDSDTESNDDGEWEDDED